MACCVVGSLLMLLAAALSRGARRYLLRQAPEQPETWRLHAMREGESAGAG